MNSVCEILSSNFSSFNIHWCKWTLKIKLEIIFIYETHKALKITIAQVVNCTGYKAEGSSSSKADYRRHGKISWAKTFTVSTPLEFLQKYFHIALAKSAYIS